MLIRFRLYDCAAKLAAQIPNKVNASANETPLSATKRAIEESGYMVVHTQLLYCDYETGEEHYLITVGRPALVSGYAAAGRVKAAISARIPIEVA